MQNSIENSSGVAGNYGSKISSYSISGGGFSGTASSLITGFLNTSGTITFTAKVTDSRGRTSSAIKVSIEVVPYSAPSFSTTSSQQIVIGLMLMQHFRRGRILYLVVEIYQQRLVMTLSIR